LKITENLSPENNGKPKIVPTHEKLQRLEELKALFVKFGVTIYGYCPGAWGFITKEGASSKVHFTYTELQWLEPILKSVETHELLTKGLMETCAKNITK